MIFEIVDNNTFADLWRERPVLVITGEDDRRIPIGYVNRRIANLEAGGVAVTKRIYPGEGHFLLFSQSENVLSDVSNWLKLKPPQTVR